VAACPFAAACGGLEVLCGMAEADAPGAKRAKRAKFTSAGSLSAGAPPPPRETTFTWELKDLTLESFTAAQPDEKWLSQDFNACGVRWRLCMYPSKTMPDAKEGGSKSVWLFLWLREPSCTIHLGNVTLYCTGVAALSLRAAQFSTLDPKPANCGASLGTMTFIRHDLLIKTPEKYLPCGTLTVTATLRPRAFAAIALPAVPAPRLISDWRALLASGEDSDVTFEAGDEILRAHSIVVSLRSGTLKGLLRSGTKKSRTISVPPEIEPAVFKQLLEYLYTEDMKLESSEHAQHMLHAADFYGVEPLRSLCSTELCKSLSAANVLTTLMLAHQNSCPELRSYALRFAAANASAVLVSSEWSELKLKHAELSDAVVHTMAHGEPPATIASAPSAAAAESA